jgi:hypothetical protein
MVAFVSHQMHMDQRYWAAIHGEKGSDACFVLGSEEKNTSLGR